MFVVYKAEFPNGKVYIGKSKNFENRKYHHIWNSKRSDHKHIMMSRAINKYGPDSIKWSIICECLSYDDMNQKEIEFIKLYNSTLHEFGYNMVCGDKFVYEKRNNFDENYKVDIIKKKLKSNGHDPDKYVVITDELKSEIINDYVDNKLSRNALVKKYSISKQRMSRLLKSENIEINMNKSSEVNSKKFDIEYINKIIELFNSGLNIKTIGEQENLTIMIVSRILHDSGTRMSSRFKNGKRYDGKQPKIN
jgi:hypothetical protein